MATQDPHAISLRDVQAAAARIAPYVHHTPVLTCKSLESIVSSLGSGEKRLHFKAEVFQRTGSFKARGALNAVLSLDDETAAKGVVTHSSGNHGAALAYAAQTQCVPAHIVVPRNTPQVKIDAIKGYGGSVTLCEPTIDAREATCAALQASTGASLVQPYNHPAVMAGQGTIALELLGQVPDLDAIVVPISGGGMISGIAVAAKALKPSIKVYAAEPLGINPGGGAADTAACKAAGALVSCPKPMTVADGLQGRLGDLTWPVVRDLVDGVLVVSEEEIVAAMRLVYERLKVVVEPSGAVGLAAVLAQRHHDDTAGVPSAPSSAPSAQTTTTTAGADSSEQQGQGQQSQQGQQDQGQHGQGHEQGQGQEQGLLYAGRGLLAGPGCANIGVVLCGANVDLGAKGFFDMALWQPAH